MKLLAVAAALCVASKSLITADTVDVQISDVQLSGALPGDFAVFSMEVPSAIAVFTVAGDGKTPRESWVNLMRNLQQASGSGKGPNIRIGGNSADESVYLPGSAPLPPNDTYRITDADIASYALVVPMWNGSITLDVNFRYANDPSFAVSHVAAALKAMPPGTIDGIEIGNECDLYFENGIRSPGYNYSQYDADFDSYQQIIQSETGVVYPRIQGATWCCGHFDSSLNSFITKYAAKKVISSISYHHYPLSVCKKGTVNTIAELLADTAAQRQALHLAPYVQTAISVGVPFHIGEGNSVSCGGQYGVSNTFAATLWSMDVLFNMAAVGITRWNFHGGPGGAYTYVAYKNVSSDVPDVRALYYGIWGFNTVTANGAVVHNMTYNKWDNKFVKVWPTLDADGKWKVAILHKDANATSPATVTVRPPSGAKTASTGTVVRLAPTSGGAAAEYGIVFGGLTFDGSQDGRPQGTPVSETVPAANDGSFTVTVNPVSIVLLSF